MAVRDQRKLRTGISTAFAKRVAYTADGEPVVQNNGAVQIAAEKELDFGCAPTADSNNTIAEVLNGGLRERTHYRACLKLGADDHLKLGG